MLFREVDCAVHVTQAIDDEIQRLLVVTHPTKEKDHLQYEITLVADVISL